MAEWKIIEAKCHKGGKALANLLHLKKNKNGRYDTSWGDKTELGLYLTIKRVVEENM